MKTDAKLADELDVRDRLIKKGYTWKKCGHCHGSGVLIIMEDQWHSRHPFRRYGAERSCVACNGRGGTWVMTEEGLGRRHHSND